MKRKLLLISVVALLLVGWFLYQLFGPSSKVELGRETTYITSPLAEDGLPNYALAILEKQREGVTPENNGALPFWRAMGPQDHNNMSPADFKLLCAEIGLEDVDSQAFLLRAYSDEQVYADFGFVPSEESFEEYEDEEQADEKGSTAITKLSIQDKIDVAQDSPWTAKQYPPLASWVERNNRALDFLIEAGKRTMFYSPSASVLRDSQEMVLVTSNTSAQAARKAVRALSLRGMLHVGEGDLELAWQDFFAIMQLGDHIASGDTIVDKLVGIAIRGVALECTHTLLTNEQLPLSLAQRMLNDLESLKPSFDMAGAIDYGERLMFLDAALRVTCGRFGKREDFSSLSLSTPSGVEQFAWEGPINPNPSLKLGNRWYDRLAKAARISDREARQAAFDEIDNELASLGPVRGLGLLSVFLNKSSRSRKAAEVLLGLFLPSTQGAMTAEDRLRTNLELHRIAAALAIYRIEHGEYPENLVELAPAILKQLPVDWYSGKPYRYEHRGAGYLLYSVYLNGKDDGGDDYSGKIIDGEWVEEPVDVDYAEASDLVIRLPLPE